MLNDDLSWCKPGLAPKFIMASSIIVFLFSAAVLIYTLLLTLKAADGNHQELEKVKYIFPVIAALAALTVLISFVGCTGAHWHRYWFLFVFVVTVLLTQLGQGVCSLVLLTFVAEEENRIRGSGQVLDENTIQSYALAANMSAGNLILAGFQFFLAFFVGIVMGTDSTPVYKADYL